MEQFLTYLLEEKEPSANKITDAIFNWLSVISGFKFKKVSEGNSDIYYGNNDNNSIITIKRNSKDILWNELIQNKASLSQNIGFDFINGIIFFMGDKVNPGNDANAYDRHSRLKFENSYQALNGISEIPIVNLYVKYFKDVITKYKAVNPANFYPGNKKYAIGLSHDVDKPLKFQFLRNFRFNKHWGAKDKMYHTARYLHNRKEYIFSDEKKKFSDFESIMKEESKYGFKSTFYFASSSGYSDWGSVNDVFYDIAWDEFRPVFNSINEKGFNIGLHASYNANKNSAFLITEKENLQKISNAEIKGLRHHYWHLGSDENLALKNHYDAGFSYDSSLAFNEHIGFRRNAAMPYYPLDIDKNEVINCLQIPVFCMDGNFFYKEVNVDKAVQQVKKYIEQIKKFEGVGVIDWHSETSFPQKGKYEKWAEAYLKILEYLSQDSEAWVTSPDEIYNHFAEHAVQTVK